MVAHLTGMLNDFLSISKIEEGKFQTTPSAFNLKEFFEDLIDEFKEQSAIDRKIYSEYQGERDGFFDKNLLTHILHNLISNAIKYSNPDTRVWVEMKNNADGLHIKVEDEGIGIPESEHSKVFSRFFRAANTGNVQGTGLGLNIVNKYVELMGGTIVFESESEKGTVFKIYIPQQ